MSAADVDVEDEIQAMIVLSSLSKSWNEIVTGMHASVGKTKLTLNEVRDLIVGEETRRKESYPKFVVAFNTRSRDKVKSKSRGRHENIQNNDNSDKDDDPNNGRCH